jgi:AraC-like DNA-binding protein
VRALTNQTPCLGELLERRPLGSPPRGIAGPVAGEILPERVPTPGHAVRLPPACDFAEARVWEALGGGWQCLYGCYCQCGVSIEWHDFACAEPRDWSRSFHPDSVEICLNLSGHARLTCGSNSTLLGPMTAGLYHVAEGGLAAWRLPGERHQFLTLEYSRAYLEQHLKGHELALHPMLRGVLHHQNAPTPIASVFRLTVRMKQSIEAFRHPPVAGPARGLWYQGRALEIAAEFFFAREGAEPARPSRVAEVGRQRVERAIHLLAQRLAAPPSLEELGRALGCSPYHLSRTFSKEMGMTIPQYLRQVRMERAAELLKSGKFNVTEAALEVGYSSLSHFSQAFCETIGCCPGLYPTGIMGPQLAAATRASRRQ